MGAKGDVTTNRLDIARTARKVLRAYGPGIYGFLCVVLEERRLAREVYQSFEQGLCQRLLAFRRNCSLRVFAYALVRRELMRHRYVRSPVELVIACSPRTIRFAPYRRATVDLRATLFSGVVGEDREILVLRLDRGFCWRDLAVTSIGNTRCARSVVDEAGRLRRRFKLIRRALLRRARQLRAVG